ncbi:MAG: TerC family protein [Proteobacteria bacterium]|nr:TerC family protein [Pseudomonadota bacterium]
MYFPFADYWWLYLAFTLFVVILLLLDLGVFHRDAHEVRFKEALGWSVVWIGLALIFNLGFYFFAHHRLSSDAALAAIPGFDAQQVATTLSLEFLTGFLVEKSLAIDNIFVFVLVFSYFAIPAKYQHRVLFYGILGALVFRGLFIAAGSYLMHYHWVVLFFGGLLLLTGVKILIFPDSQPDLEKNPVLKLARKFFNIHPRLEGQRFFIRDGGKLFVTPLFLALVFIEFSDIIFAIDSVPAIFALTKEPLIVYTSNVFAILGLRALYFLMADVVRRFRYIKYGLGFILIFVGLKMVWLNEAFGGKFPIGISLGIIGTILAGSILLSVLIKPSTVPSTANS